MSQVNKGSWRNNKDLSDPVRKTKTKQKIVQFCKQQHFNWTFKTVVNVTDVLCFCQQWDC